MKTSNKLLLASAACMTLMSMHSASAEIVTTKTMVHQKELPNMKKTDFLDFDLNKDSVLSMKEVGEKLFYIFDTDGNEVIDNIEFNHKQIMTIIPMEKDTFTYVDWDSDGDTDVSSYTYEMFFKKSGLMRFDKNMDGLSASEFIAHRMLALDDDNSKVYEESTRALSAEQERYQQ